MLAVALTNGSNTTEQFHFYDEIDSNAGKTASGRLAIRLLPLAIEIGVSGSAGPQDRATDTAALDVVLRRRSDGALGARRAQGPVDDRATPTASRRRACTAWTCTSGGYLELDAMLTSSLGVLGRGEYRDAFVWLADQRAYLTKSWRATVGVRWVLTPRAVFKAEYLRNGEYGGVPPIANDVFTTSLVMGF